MRYRLRTLLVLLTILTVPMAWLGYRRVAAIKEQKARDSFHALVRDATLLMKSKAEGKEVYEVEAAFSEAGYAPISSRDTQYTSLHRHLLQKAAWTATNGTPHDLMVEASVDRRDVSQSTNARPGIATVVTAGLIGHPNISLDEALQKAIYPATSCVGICLAHERTLEEAMRFPILKKVEITYDLIRHHRSAEWPFGYHVVVELGSSADDDKHGIRLHFTVGSNLDPRQDWSGNSLTEGFVPSTELGGAHWWGGSEWHASE